MPTINSNKCSKNKPDNVSNINPTKITKTIEKKRLRNKQIENVFIETTIARTRDKDCISTMSANKIFNGTSVYATNTIKPIINTVNNKLDLIELFRIITIRLVIIRGI